MNTNLLEVLLEGLFHRLFVTLVINQVHQCMPAVEVFILLQMRPHRVNLHFISSPPHFVQASPQLTVSCSSIIWTSGLYRRVLISAQ